MNGLSSFLSSMLALSIGVERVVEILKSLVTGLRPHPPAPEKVLLPKQEAWKTLRTHLAATAVGTAMAYGIGPEQFVPGLGTGSASPVLASVLVGLLGSGGSAMWNHALDIAGAFKQVQESTARQALKAEAKANSNVAGSVASVAS